MTAALTWSTDICRHHNDRVKKLITEPGNPNLIISAAEDSSGLASPLLLSFSMQTVQTARGRISGLSIIRAGLSIASQTALLGSNFHEALSWGCGSA